MKIGLFYPGFLPKEGGTGYVLKCLEKAFSRRTDILYFFNPYSNEKNTIKIPEIQKFRIKEILRILLNKKSFGIVLQSFWVIFKDKSIRFTDRIRILIFFLIKPQVFIYTFLCLKEILPHLKSLDLDIILGGATTENILPLTFIISRLLGKKVCSLTYGNDFLVKSKFSLQSFYIRNLDLIILGTKNMKNLISKIHPIDNNQLRVIRYGLDFDDYNIINTKEELRNEFSIPLDKFVILSVGRHVTRKNFNLVIEAISNIKNKYFDIDLIYVLIGEGEATKRLKELTKQLGLESEIKFLGFTSQKIRNSFYKLSDLFIMPSSREPQSIEGFGIVFLEANFFGCPVIGTFSGGINEAIIEGETGFLVEENNLEDLTEKIWYLYNNRQKAKELGIKGHQRVINEFNWDIIIDDYIEVFKNLLEKNIQRS